MLCHDSMKRDPEEPASSEERGAGEDGQVSKQNARRGLVLFGAYLVFYGGFVFLNAFNPRLMEATPVAGLNLAVLYGMGLIAGALVLAVIYAWLCRGADR